MTINPMHHIVLISSRERTLQPTTIPTYHRHIIDASHHGTQQYNHLHLSSRTCFILHHQSVHLFHYTHCSTGPMEAARSFLNMRLMNGVRSMLIDFRLTTSYQSPARRWLTTNILHCQPYSYHIKIMYFWNCRYTNLEKKGPRLPIHCYLNT